MAITLNHTRPAPRLCDHLREKTVVDILARLVNVDPERRLPEWTYFRWCQALEYRDLGDRAQERSREIGRVRDRVLADPDVRALVEWAGSRRRSQPGLACAAALVTTRLAQTRAVNGEDVDPCELADRIARAISRARRPRRAGTTPPQLLADPDRLPTPDADTLPGEHPLLTAVVAQLLREAGVELDMPFSWRVEATVIQAAEWWARHAAPVPVALEGPRLPGVSPAESLRDSDRLSAHIADPSLLDLVAGPQPGRGRPCQVAWRRGLTFWTAVRLTAEGADQVPPGDALDWWRLQLSRPHRGPAAAQVAPVTREAC